MYGIYTLNVNLFSPNSVARCTRSFVLRKQINACVNTIRQHLPLRNLYILESVRLKIRHLEFPHVPKWKIATVLGR